jgi:predicted permease
MSALSENLRYALRNLRKSPVFTGVAVLSLGLGIGANTAIFTLMDQVLLRTLPVKDPHELVEMRISGPNQGAMRCHGDLNCHSYPFYRDIRDRNQVFSGVLARYAVPLALTYGTHTERARGELVSGNYFEVLGIGTAIGRTLTNEDDRTPGAHPVAVISYDYWSRRFGRDPGILNQKILINSQPMTIIGVSEPGFSGVSISDRTEVMIPIAMKATATPTWVDFENRRSLWLEMIARRKPGVSVSQAVAGMQTIMKPILEEESKTLKNWNQKNLDRFINKKVTITDAARGRAGFRRQFETPLIVLMSMVGVLLLIACANMANLLLARAAGRQKEIAIRLALGAGRGRVMRQLLVESLTLAMLGGLAGLLIANWAGSLLLQFLPAEGAGRALSTTPDLRVLIFTFALSLVTGVLFGMAPALQSTHPKLADTLKDQASNVSAGKAHVRIRKSLVAAQVALSLLLLIGAGLFAKSLYNLKNVATGYNAESVLAFSIDASINGYTQPRMQELFDRLNERLLSTPGVRSAALAEVPVLAGSTSMSTVIVEGYKRKEDEDMNPHVNFVGPAFFATLGVPLLRGREFTKPDALGAKKVCIINEKMAEYFFKTENPLGRLVGFAGSKVPDMEIVGVVKNARYSDLREDIPRTMYVPYMQDEAVETMTGYVRTAADPQAMGGTIRSILRELDANLPVYGMRTMNTVIGDAMYTDRLIAALSSFFGILATLLAAVGLYGVMAYTVTRRTREIGVRVALGADRSNVLWLVMREVAVLTIVGIAIALPSAWGLSRFVRTQLYGLEPYDPWIVAGATLALAFAAILAGYVPARRATRVDPLVALRDE